MAGSPNSLQGARRFVDVAADNKVRSVEKSIELLESDKTAFMKVLAGLPRTNVKNVTHEWYVDEVVPSKYALGANLLATGGAGPIAGQIIDLTGLTGYGNDDIFVRAGERLKIAESGEIVEVEATPAAGGDMSAVVVTRDLAGIDPAQVDAPGMVLNLGDTSPENSIMYSDISDPASLKSLTTQKRRHYNYTETVRTAIGMSRRQLNSDEYGGDDMALQRMKDTLSHIEKLNHKSWHGVRIAATGDGKTSTGGIIWAIENEVDNAGDNTFDLNGSALDESTFNDFLRTFSRYGNTQKKMLVASAWVCDQISGFSRVLATATNVRRSADNGKDKTLGTHIGEYTSGTGFQCKIVSDNALEGIPGDRPSSLAVNPGSVPGTYDGLGVLLDMAQLGLIVHGGTFMEHDKDARIPSQDGVAETLTTDFGVKYGDPRKMGLLKGVA